MLRTILLVVYLAATLAGACKRGSGWDPLGLTSDPPPPPPETDARCGWDPLG